MLMYTVEELKYKKAVYTEAVRRKLAAEREADQQVDNGADGDEMQGVRNSRGMPGRALSGIDKIRPFPTRLASASPKRGNMIVHWTLGAKLKS
jgi:hypothetical protein